MKKTKEAYIRLGDETILAPSHILNELVLKGMNRTYDSIISIHKKRDFSFSYFEATYFERTHTKFKELDYISMKLMEKDGVLTNTGLLLSDQNIIYQSRVFCTHWDGKTKTSLNSEAIDDKEISGSIVHQLVASLEFIKNNMKKKWHKSGVYRVDKPDYDLDAIREAIVNALIHRDYSRVGCEVTIDLYQDRLEITSPGGMISGEKLELNTHSSIPSERRNPFLADIFSRMGFMERRGSGLNKIIDKTNVLFKDEKVHVEYFSTNNFFRVIIKNANYKFDAVKTENFDAVNVQNEVNDAVKIGAQSSVDAVEREVAQFDAVKTEDFDAVNVQNGINDAVNDAGDAVNDAVESEVVQFDAVKIEDFDAVNDADDAVNDAGDAVNDAIDAVNDADDAVNDAIDAVNDAGDAVNDADDAVKDTIDAVESEVVQFDAVKTEEFDAVNVQNEGNDVVKIGVQSSVDAVESEVAQFDAVKTEEFDAVNVQNEGNDAVKIGTQSSVDAVESKVARFDAVKIEVFDAVNSNFQQFCRLNELIIEYIEKYPGLRIPNLFNLLNKDISNLTINMIRNCIRRELKDKVVFIGNPKTGGYFLK